MSRGFLIGITFDRYNAQQTAVISGFSFTFITHKL